MGRVFSAEQIEQDEIPTLTDFAVADDAFTDAAQLAVDRGDVIGAVVYGSVAAGSPGPRSDHDNVIVLHDTHQFPAAQYISHQAFLGGNRKVPISTVAYTRGQLLRGHVEFDRFFAQHLIGSSRRVIGQDIADLLNLPELPARQIFNDYIRNKKRGFSEAYVGFRNDPDVATTQKRAQRLLELPIAIGRKLLAVLDEIEGTERLPVDTTQKLRVAHRAAEVFAELGVAGFAAKLAAEDRAYTDRLALMRGHSVNHPRYENYLTRLVSMMPEAHRWLNDLDRAFNDRVLAASDS